MRHREKTELRDGMLIDWDVPIVMDDGVVLRADVYRPPAEGRYPVIMTLGPYGKQLHFEDGYAFQWHLMCTEHPDVPTGSTNKYQVWEVVDPEKWVPDGYVVIRVDSRGAGTSEGVIDIWSLREAQDLAICVDWAGVQPWSNGKVGLNGISYFAENQWQTAALQPEHLAAICTWEGAADFYRDMAHHGGIFCNGFTKAWSEAQVWSVQNGKGANGYRSRLTGDWVSGPETLTEEQLGANRRDFYEDCLAHKLDTDEYWQSRMPDWNRVRVPLLSSANWGGQGLHPRGNFEGFVRSASEQKWLEVHGLEHWTEFYTDYGVALQKKFFGHFLKGEDTGWDTQPAVQLQVRHPGERFVERHEDEWPLARTRWTEYYLDAAGLTLSDRPADGDASVTYAGFGDGATFLTPPMEAETELTGPVAAKLFVSSATEDADLFLVVRVFGPDLKEVVFHGALDPHTPVAQGWLRASHRKLDKELTLPYRPYHTHDEIEPLTPGEIYELDVEIWPTCIVVPAGYRIGLTVRGRDYVYPGDVSDTGEKLAGVWNGVGPFKHDDPRDRPAEVFGGDVTVHTGPDRQSYLLLPVIPER
ncbi:CocE/NonD family hydrolase [Geodermatophilus sp. YIM 151500]|uniref:CocE/NonD family hydrolase n=1 Tax=Geodermatophilus sp. YIM 151500 TaxID=2984531 RepID=UPI0021E35FCB|nr:CocE/NonD family hydrolase [Geodermatophilus sp. YIM 151500]MCV2488856.1 CocE/NonD family hydrolase [Geodermatophilus sp. YIM 151500]